MSYVDSLVAYKRRESAEVKIGKTPLGAKNPIRVQTMLNTDTNDIDACVAQSIECIEAGAEYIRITAPGETEAENLAFIKEKLIAKGYDVPIVADIHFNPNAAEIAARIVDKVRINPGNYTDKKRLKPEELTEEDYQAEIDRIKEKFVPLLKICKEHNTAIRIGTNHGSLSDRIMGRFGDTPEGMAESAMEFLRICKEQNFTDIVLSMKASNTRIMVHANRLITKKMRDEDMYFPLHLGVTEAGDGEDGRIKSAVGIGTLLADGIGETIRVSLTEDPAVEIPVAKAIVKHFTSKEDDSFSEELKYNPVNPYIYSKRESDKVDLVGGDNPPAVISDLTNKEVISVQTLKEVGFVYSGGKWQKGENAPDYILCKDSIPNLIPIPVSFIVDYEIYRTLEITDNVFPLYSVKDFMEGKTNHKSFFIKMNCSDVTLEVIKKMKRSKNMVIILASKKANKLSDYRTAVINMINENCKVPVVFSNRYDTESLEELQIEAACDLGGLFIDGLGEGLMLSVPSISHKNVLRTCFQFLQSTGDRITKTEYISCPSCGRTYFDLMETVAKIKDRTSHLKGMKIAVMGCIVNGPGEMADAHYGYVGAGKGSVTLYKGKNVIKRAIPSEQAVDKLIDLIKDNGDWVDA